MLLIYLYFNYKDYQKSKNIQHFSLIIKNNKYLKLKSWPKQIFQLNNDINSINYCIIIQYHSLIRYHLCYFILNQFKNQPCMNSKSLLTTVFRNLQWALRNLGYWPTTYMMLDAMMALLSLPLFCSHNPNKSGEWVVIILKFI